MLLRMLAIAALLALPAGGAPDDRRQFEAAVRALRLKQYAAARPMLAELVARDPHNALYWFNYGSTLFNLGDNAGALGAFQKVVGLPSPLAPAARLAIAKSQRRLGRHGEALASLRALDGQPELAEAVRDERATLKRESMQRGLTFYEEHRYGEALSEFDVATQAAPDDESFLMKGMTLLRLGRAEESRPAFRKVLAISRNAAYRDDARTFLERASSFGGDSPWWAFLDLAGGCNSNPYLDGVSIATGGSPMLQTLAGAGAQTTATGPWLLGVGGTLYWEEFPGDSAARFLSATARGQLGYSGDALLIKAAPVAQYQYYGTSALATRLGSGLQLQHSWDDLYSGVQGDYLQQTGQAGYSYLTGSLLTVRAYFGIAGSDANVSFGVLYGRDAIGDEPVTGGTVPLGNQGYGANAVMAWYLSSFWELDGTVQVWHRSYTNVSTPGNLTRTDDQLSVNARLLYRLTHDKQVFLNGGLLHNASTLGANAVVDKNYTQVIGLAGLSWQIHD